MKQNQPPVRLPQQGEAPAGMGPGVAQMGGAPIEGVPQGIIQQGLGQPVARRPAPPGATRGPTGVCPRDKTRFFEVRFK